ncbi:MAG TPA: protealysin inhibitor emfourin [Anaerolineales bacterium]|nr:protealysin inhibitor emfourin [Anaerolineales bacterium]
MKIERIKFERAGGFAGMRLSAEFELDDLPDDQARQLIELLDDLDFDELPERMLAPSPQPDAFTYTLTVETERGKHTVVTDDASSSDKMRSLLELLTRLARQRTRKN